MSDAIAHIRPYSAGTPIARVAERAGLALGDIVKLASNENPLGCGEAARAAAANALADLGRYPDPEAPALRRALAAHLGVSVDEVVVSNGSNELLELLIRTFCSAGGHVVFGEPSFVVYRLACLTAGVPFSAVPLDAGRAHDLQAMLEAVTPDTRLVFIANPNNPTGTYVGESALSSFLRALPEDVIAVLDEAYFEYADASDYPDGLQLRALHERTVVARTFSKIHGLAALRVGYGVMPAELAQYLHRVRAPFNVNGVGQAAAVAALGDPQHVKRSQQLNSEQKLVLADGLKRLGCNVVPTQANFVLADVGRSGADLYLSLEKEGIIVRPIPPLPSCVRITVGTELENQRCLEVLGRVLGC